MAKLKLGAIASDKPVKISIDLPAAVHRDLIAYAEVLGRETGQTVSEPARLIAPMIERHGDRSGVLEGAADSAVLVDSEG